MKLIVGLGNPGIAYAASRHNIGFSVVKAISRVSKIPLKKGICKIPFLRDKRCLCMTGKGRFENKNVILAMPLTFMNLSGAAVSVLIKEFDIKPVDLLVICDDLDLEFGRLKIRGQGSSGGHRGLKSVIESLASQKFGRLRIGIGRPAQGADTADYVLSRFNKSESAQVKESVQAAVDCCRVWISDGVTKSMDIFNRWSPAPF